MRDEDGQAQRFQQVREARRNELAEDYVELIADLIDAEGEARQVDIAARLGVSQPTVAKVLKRLDDEGLIRRRSYRALFLTEAGREMAEKSRHRHQIVERFLRAHGVPGDIAMRDAEGIEHHVSDETLRVFERFLDSTSD